MLCGPGGAHQNAKPWKIGPTVVQGRESCGERHHGGNHPQSGARAYSVAQDVFELAFVEFTRALERGEFIIGEFELKDLLHTVGTDNARNADVDIAQSVLASQQA